MIRSKLVDTDIKLYELYFALLAGLRGQGKGVSVFEDFLKKKANAAEAVVFGSGKAALLAALTAIKNITKGEKSEVILPAYTPLALYVVIKQAGLKPVFCDIDLKDFGFSARCLEEKKTGKTLAVLSVRLFGLESSPKGKNDGIFVIEDNAQGFLTPLKWDLELLSFNRGKNFPLFNGGALITNDDRLAEELRKVRAAYRPPSRLNNLITFLKFKAFCLSKKRFIYNISLPVIEKMRETRPPEHISGELLSSWQAMLGAGKIFHTGKSMQRRSEIALQYLANLKELEGIELPEVRSGSVVNRFPLLVKDKNKVEEVRLRLRKAGVEASRMYLKTVPAAFETKSSSGEYKNAAYAAERLLVLPCNPFLSDKEVEDISNKVKKCFR